MVSYRTNSDIQPNQRFIPPAAIASTQSTGASMMSKAPKVVVFEWKPGENDAEYIKLLRKELDEQQKLTGKCIAKLRRLSRAYIPAVHGEWVKEEGRVNHWHCSECGWVTGLVCRFFRYCPNCAAIMGNCEDIVPDWCEEEYDEESRCDGGEFDANGIELYHFH